MEKYQLRSPQATWYVLYAVHLVAIAGAGQAGAPKLSADVVEVKLERGSIADGLETYFVSLKVAKGWHIYANPVGPKAVAEHTTTMEFFIDGKRAAVNDIYYPPGVARTDAAGNVYRAYEAANGTAWLVYEDTRDARVVSVRVKVTATDGKTRLKKSTITAEVR
jgi:hypothetical protein